MNITKKKSKEEAPKKPKASALGEDSALKGFTNQYLAAAELTYNALKNNDFKYIILKDFRVGQVDDLVIVSKSTVDAYQVKWSYPPTSLTYSDFKKYFVQLFNGLTNIRKLFPSKVVTTYLYTSNIASTSKAKNIGPFSNFIFDYWLNDKDDKEIELKWKVLTDELKKAVNITTDELKCLRRFLKFSLNHKRPEDREEYKAEDRYYQDISHLADVLLKEAGRIKGTIELNRNSILKLVGWSDRSEFRSKHHFEIPPHYQAIESTVDSLNNVINKVNQGYIALIGTPGSGKSTLLTETLRYRPKTRAIPYYCFVPNDTAIHARSEATNFLHDIVLSLKAHNISTKNLAPGESLEQLRSDFEDQLHELARRFQEDGILTLILVDGLDHVKREGKPDISLLRELPRPSAIPEGVLFVLGSQNIEHLELQSEIKDQLKTNKSMRTITMESLSIRSARDASRLALPEIELTPEHFDLIMQKSSGHPLALNYILNKIKKSIDQNISETIMNLPPYEENIERQYEKYWRTFEGETDLVDLLALLSRMRGLLDLEVVEGLAATKETIKKLISSAGQYFKQDSNTHWSFFHNSFRQFILDKTGRNAFQIDKPEINRKYHEKLACVADAQPDLSIFRWEKLYHTYHAEAYEDVLSIGMQGYFRKQFFNGRGLNSIIEDLDLVMRSAKECCSPISVIRTLLIYDELSSRAYILEERDFPKLLLNLAKIDEAISHVFSEGRLLIREYKALEISAILYDLGYIELSRKIFDAAEPLDKIEGTNRHYDLYAGEGIIDRWLEAAIRFRSIPELLKVIEKLETDEPGRSSEELEKKTMQLRRHYHIHIVDEVLDIGNNDEINKLPELMSTVMDKVIVQRRISSYMLSLPDLDLSDKEEHCRFLVESIGNERLTDHEKLLLCGFLVKSKRDLNQASNIFESISMPETLNDSGYLSEPDAMKYYMRQFRYHRLHSALKSPIDPKEAIPESSNEDYKDIVNVTRMIVTVANCWGQIWKGNKITVAAYLETLTPLIRLFENLQLQRGSNSLKSALAGFHRRYMELIIYAAAEHGEECLNQIQREFLDSWASESKSKCWTTWIRRVIAKEFFECGLPKRQFAQIIQKLDDEDIKLSPEKELREFLEECEEKAVDWYQLGEVEKSHNYLEKMVKSSFGITHEKDRQINHWTELFLNIFRKAPDVVENDFRFLAEGVATNAKYCRARDSTEGAIDILSFLTTYNPDYANELKYYFWENSILEFSHTVKALIIASTENKDIPIQLAAALYRWLYLPYERYTDKEPIKGICRRLCSLKDRESAVEMLAYLQEGIDLDVSQNIRGTYWSVFVDTFENEGGQEDLLEKILPCINRQKPKIDHTLGSITLKDGTIIQEENLLVDAKDPDRLIEILENTSEDSFYGWWRLIKKVVHKMDVTKTERLLDILIEKEKYGRDVEDLIINLQKLGAKERAESYALKLLSKSTSHGWSYYYDGGTRIVPYKALVGINDDKYRQQALHSFIDDFLQGNRSDHISSELEDYISLFWETPTYKEIWPEIREHVFQLREFNIPAIEIPKEFDLTKTSKLSALQVIVGCFFDAFEMPQIELREDAFKAICYLYNQAASLQSLIEEKINGYLNSELENPLLGMALIIGISIDENKKLVKRFSQRLESFLSDPDMSKRLLAKDALSIIGSHNNIRFNKKELPGIYELDLPEYETTKLGIPSASIEPGTVLYDTGDPLEFISLAKEALELIHYETKLPFRNLVERCILLMRELVPESEWNSVAEAKMQSWCRSLRVETSYRRPRTFVAFYALAHLVAELYDAGVINNKLLKTLRPSLSPIDTQMLAVKTRTNFNPPVEISVPKDHMNSSDWVKLKPAIYSEPPKLDEDWITLGLVVKAEIPRWERPKEFIIGCIGPANKDMNEIQQRPDQLIPGRNMSLWWRADQYPDCPLVDIALEHSLLIRGALLQRVEIGRHPWLALNPLVAKKLNWTIGDRHSFQWVDENNSVMVESVCWQSGRLDRHPPADGVRLSGWLVRSSKKGFAILTSTMGNADWIYAVQKEHGGGNSGYDFTRNVWCNSFPLVRGAEN